jgi:hypothetical protein
MAQVRVTAKAVVKDLGWKRMKSNARSLDGRGVNVGILPADAGKRGMSRDWSGNPIRGTARVVDYAVWNEYGTEKIPSRPFMRRAFDANTAEIGRRCARAAHEFILYGRGAAVDPLHELGRWYVTVIRETIDTAIRWATPLSPVTIAKKGHDLPLIDFGTLRSVIKYVVRR